jgi:hypothetical protein
MNNQPEFVEAYTSFGVNFRLCSNSKALLGRMSQAVPFETASPGSELGGDVFALTELSSGNYRLASPNEEHINRDLPQLLEQLREKLMVHVADYAEDRVFVHAGVVAWHGRAVVFPGVSFAGKSTLVAECVRAGATYFSDEYAVFDKGGTVHSYARDLQMRRPGHAEQTSVPIASFNGTAATAGSPVHLVIFTQYVEAAVWSPEPVTAGMAVLAMLPHTIPVQRTPGRVLSTLSNVMSQARAFRSQRGEAADLVQQVFHDLEGKS